MPALSWIDGLWRRIGALIQRIFGPRPPALAAGRELSRGAGPQAVTPTLVMEAAPLAAEAAVVVANHAAVAAEAAAEVVASGEVAGLRGSGVQAGARPAMSVRRYFGRLVAATPAGLTIDLTRWQTASVERYFLAITSPGLIRRREAATTGAEVLRLPNAFEGFEWD